jgi:hypothetical protein
MGMPCEGEKGDHGDGQGRWGVERGVGGGDATRVKGEKEMGERGKKGKKKNKLKGSKSKRLAEGRKWVGGEDMGLKWKEKF